MSCATVTCATFQQVRAGEDILFHCNNPITSNQESFCYCCHCWGEVETLDILTEEKELEGKKKVTEIRCLLMDSPLSF